MGETTKIEWADHTFNPWIGCTKISPACDHCYAEAMDGRFGGGHWGATAPRKLTSDSNWLQPLAWDRAARKAGVVRRVFCASLADVFDNRAPEGAQDRLWALIRQTTNLRWLLLTKRPQNIAGLLPADLQGDHRIWLGATVENQAEAARRIPHLLEVPAAVRFLSCEPLLGPLNLRSIDISGDEEVLPLGAAWMERLAPGETESPSLDWIIVGGESGTKARPMHPDWARDLRDQCQAAGVPFLFKQWGEWTPGENVDRRQGTVATAHWYDEKWLFDRESLARSDGHIDDEPDLYRVGKKEAGRHLDGVEWNQVPTPAAAE